MNLPTTPSQTVGPFFRIGLEGLNSDSTGAEGPHLVIRGQVLDGIGQPVPDAVLEIWQADARGQYAQARADSGFKGFCRLPTGSDGRFRFSTVKPGSVPGPGGAAQAPHVVVLVFMRGLLKHLMTRIYFPGEAGNGADPILRLVPEARRATLIARAVAGELEWDVRLQGNDETVFFDY
jgi:protocatechuate 3,4-dioxygenase alpha subunit